MTDVTQDQGQDGPELSAADEQVLLELTERARTGGLKLTGQGGLLGRLTKMVVEGALEGELDDHLGYGKHDPEGRDGVAIQPESRSCGVRMKRTVLLRWRDQGDPRGVAGPLRKVSILAVMIFA